MKDQILRIIEAEGLTPAKFADEIGVQRSSISHIISGRNKPSYDFIMKIIERFRGINTEWLLTGKGSMIKSSSSDLIAEKSGFETNSVNEKLKDIQPDMLNNENKFSDKSVGNTAEIKFTKHISTNSKTDSDIEFTNVNSDIFILIFYKDGSYKKYISRE